MEKLIQGIRQFQSHVFPTQRPLFEKLAEEGQKPEVLFITCSDSGVAPALLTQSTSGELFIIRNVGNILPPYTHQAGGDAASLNATLEVKSENNFSIFHTR